jgi:single-strand DNA-binding protein
MEMHTIIITGRLGRDPEMRFTESGKPVTSFSVADNRRYTGADGEPREETVWFDVTAWGRLAETCNEHLAKGRQVAIEGRLKPIRVWTGNDGQARASYEVTARSVEFLGTKPQQEAASEPEVAPPVEEDIPF